MTKYKKIGIIFVLVGLCLPTATLPFIKEFHPQPNICLTSNFFGNMGNMIVAFGTKQISLSDNETTKTYSPIIAIPYRYFFAFGAILVCIGIGTIVLYYPTSNR